MSNLGFGAMIEMCRGDGDTIGALRSAVHRTIAKITLVDNTIAVTFADGSLLQIQETAQSCCEQRYTRTDDDLDSYQGATFVDIAIKDAPSVTTDDRYGEVHDVQFLELSTSRGPLTFSNHIEHNGYYGGFCIAASFTSPGEEVLP